MKPLGKAYEEAEPIQPGERKTLPPGGYVVTIVGVNDNQINQATGKGDYLEIFYDVAEGEHKGFFRDDFRLLNGWAHRFIKSYKQDPSDPKKAKQVMGMFRGFLETVDKANGTKFEPMAAIGLDEKQLVGKQIGIIIGEEEYMNRLGEVKTRQDIKVVLPDKIRSGKFAVPELKKLSTGDRTSSPAADAPAGFTFTDEDIPF